MDITTLLPDVLKPYAPWIVLFLAFNAYVIVPSLPVPTETSASWYRFGYNVLGKLAGNYGNASANVPPKL